jgi:hypothetical protein
MATAPTRWTTPARRRCIAPAQRIAAPGMRPSPSAEPWPPHPAERLEIRTGLHWQCIERGHSGTRPAPTRSQQRPTGRAGSTPTSRTDHNTRHAAKPERAAISTASGPPTGETHRPAPASASSATTAALGPHQPSRSSDQVDHAGCMPPMDRTSPTDYTARHAAEPERAAVAHRTVHGWRDSLATASSAATAAPDRHQPGRSTAQLDHAGNTPPATKPTPARP